MSNKESENSPSEVSVPEIWTSLKDRLEPTQSRSRYLVSDDGGLSEKAMENLLDAHDLALNRPVSLKQLRPDDTIDSSELDAFINEARLTGSLQHPNIIPVHDLIPDENGALYFTLRHVDGEKLSSLLKAGKLASLNEGITIFTKVCDAISYAHNNGVQHTALSGKSIIVGNFGEVFVLNWGRAVNESEPVDTTYEDIAALGRILRTIVKSAVGTSQKIPLSLDAIIRRAVRPKGTNYPSVEALRADIGRYLSGLPTEAEEASFVRQAVLLARRHKVETTGVVAALVVTIIMTVGFIRGIRAERERAIDAATTADAARASVEANTKVELERIEQLRLLIPMVIDQIKIDITNGRLEDALERAEIAMELTRDEPHPDVLELNGDILQLLNRFEKSVISYGEIPLDDKNTARIQKKIMLSRECIRKSGTVGPGDNVLGSLYLGMVASNRMHEANYILNDFQQRQLAALKDLPTVNSQISSNGTFRIRFNPDTEITGTANAGELDVIWNCADNSVSSFELIRSLPFTALECRSGSGIKSLDALRGKPLMVLKLKACNVDKLTALTDLPLKYLRMDSSEVRALDPLRGMPLEILILRNSPYASLAPVSDVPLKVLDISGSRVQSLAALKTLKLEKLSVANTRVSGLSGLDSSQLRVLNINQTGISSLDGIGMGKLVTLTARETSLSDLGPLAGSPLARVDLEGTNISSLDPLKTSPLTNLSVAGTKIDSLEPIASTNTLKVLNISGLSVSELPKNDWRRLTSLIANRSKLTSLQMLEGKPLRVVELAETPIEDISPIVNRLLHRLNVSKAPVTDLSPLAGSNVKYLNVSGTKVTDLRPLKDVSLSSLNISDTAVTSLTDIGGQPLTELDIRGTQVTDLQPLKGSSIRFISLDPERLNELVTILADLPFLEKVTLGNKTYQPENLPRPGKGE